VGAARAQVHRLRELWEALRANLWFVPTVIVVGSIALAVGLIELNGFSDRKQLTEHWPRLFGAGADGARGLLAAIAGSMITVAGVTFSITVVTLALASSQYTSRILANFMRDRANQSVLGVFLGVFAYCLVVLRTIRGGDEDVFVPAFAVLGALLLALVAVGFLIFFIHHIAEAIQATSVIETTAHETLRAVDRLFPSRVGEPLPGPASERGEVPVVGQWTPIPARRTGYIQGVDPEALLDVARDARTVVRMERGIGDFVIEGCPLVSVTGARSDPTIVRSLNEAYTIGRHRTVHQDAAYGVRQIVDVALKALSPGINDSTTAINCLDFLGAVLARLVVRQVEPTHRSDGELLRVIARGPTFANLLAEAFDQIRQNARGDVAVLTRMLEIIALLAQRTTEPDRRLALRRHAELVVETADRTVPASHDRAAIQAAQRRASAIAGVAEAAGLTG
jgi:uncharacterized membrane protein